MNALYDEIKKIYDGVQSGVVKSIQRGVVSAATGGTTVTISPVDINKAVVNVASGRAANDTVTITNSTSIRVTTSTAGNVNWQVVEYK